MVEGLLLEGSWENWQWLPSLHTPCRKYLQRSGYTFTHHPNRKKKKISMQMKDEQKVLEKVLFSSSKQVQMFGDAKNLPSLLDIYASLCQATQRKAV